MTKIQDIFHLIRFNKQTGTILLLLPCLWSIYLFSENWPDSNLIVPYIGGAFLMRSAGCIINDIFDRDFDLKVERTRKRPIASGKISVKQAIFYLLLIMLWALILLLQLPYNTVILGLLSPLLFVFYPLMKRFTYYPQLFLGITFNYGILMGFSSVKENFEWSLVILYIAGILWTLIYDTIYAFQDIEDDRKIGLKSLTFKIKDNSKSFFYICSIIKLGLFLQIGYMKQLSYYYYPLLLLAFIIYIIKLKNLNLKNNSECANFFNFNSKFGFLILIAIIIGKINVF